jgi:putative inorganic carbon (HCO3(-)) transporter
MLVAGLAVIAWYGRPRHRLAAAAVASVGALILPLTLQQAVPSADAAGPGLAHTVAGRVELWSRAVDAIRDAPLTGVGMNAFRVVMPERYPPFLFPITDLAHAHNHLLQAALDVGLPGLVAYASIWLIIGALLVRVLRLSDERVYRSIAGGIGAGLIAHFVFGLTDAIPLGAKVGVLFWLTLALTCSLHRVAVAPSTGAGSRV